MLATNPVQPRSISRIEILGIAGPHEAYPRKQNSAPFPVAKALGVGAGILAAYMVVGSLAAGGGQPVSTPVGVPTAKQGPVVVTPIVPAPGEFRLAPGNNQPPGMARFDVPEMAPVPGEFRLGPGNNEAPGIVRFELPAPVPGDFRLGPGNNQPPGLVAE